MRATYAEAVHFADEQLGTLFDLLRRRGLWERSLVVVWSDHGEGLQDHESWLHNELFEHTIRVPFILRMPGLEPQRIAPTVSAIDVAPTLLDLAGAAVPASMDGRSLLPLLAGEARTGPVFSEAGRRLYSLRAGAHHLIWDAERKRYAFFDLDADPHETRDFY